MEIYVADAQYAYREMPSYVKPGGWWGVPFFVNMLGQGEYCGSSYVDTPFNAFCYEHCDFRPWGGNPPSIPLDGSPTVDEPNNETDTPADTEIPEVEEPIDTELPDDSENSEGDDSFWDDWDWNW